MLTYRVGDLVFRPVCLMPLHIASGERRQAEAVKAAQETRPALEPEGGTNLTVAKNGKQLPLPKGSTSAKRRVARLKRDYPEAAERLARGEFKSVAAAERFARGEEPDPPRKVAPLEEQAWRLWLKMSKAGD
jgi:hypothetical protein